MIRRVLPVLLLVSLLAGCSGTASPVSPATQVRAAIVATAAAGPSRVAVEGRTAVAGQEIPLQGDGVLDPRAQAADLTLRVPSLGDVRVVFAGGRLDARLPPAASGLIGLVADGKPWVSVDADRLARSSYGAPLGALGVGTSQNPARQLAWLDAIRDDVREVGPEQVAGRDATHYVGVVDLDRVPGAQDPSTRPAVDLLKQQLGSSTLPVDLWVADGRLVKVAQTVTVPAQGTGAPTSTTTALTFTDVGGAPAVVAPPADQVADLGRFLPAG